MSIELSISSHGRTHAAHPYTGHLARAEAALARLASDRPGFLEILDDGDDTWPRCVDLVGALGDRRYAILGIGGSALGARTISDALLPGVAHEPSVEGRPGLVVLDNIDPATVTRAVPDSALPETRFVAISKSGSTAETIAQLLYFRQRMISVGIERWQDRCLIVTDPENGPLRELARTERIPSLEVPPRVGGRFSVLTAVGLLPAAILGLDGAALLSGARSLRDAILGGGEARRGLTSYLAEQATSGLDGQRPIQVLFSYCDRLGTFGDWFCQLWAESLGKRHSRSGDIVHRGSTPISAVGATDQHSLVQLFREGPDDKQYLVIGVDEARDRGELPADAAAVHESFGYLGGRSLDELFRAERDGTVLALREVGRPTSELRLEKLDAFHLGALFLFFELATAVAGDLYDVDPFDQPGVEAGKVAAFALMERPGYADKAAALLNLASRDDRDSVRMI